MVKAMSATGSFIYETHLAWEGGRRGVSRVGELPVIQISPPAEFRGEAGYWSSEHLLIAAVEACVMTAFLDEAERSGVEVCNYRSSACVKAARDEDGPLRFGKVVVRCEVAVRGGPLAREKALEAMRQADRDCPVAAALGIPLEVVMEIEGAGE